MTPIAGPIAITMGDPAGIGPEITLKVVSDQGLSHRPIVIGDLGVLQRAARTLHLGLDVVELSDPGSATGRQKFVEVLCVHPPLVDPPIGRIDAACGQAAFDYIRTAIDLARSGEISALVTAPIHKEALSMAGIGYPGHTEMLTDLGGAEHTAMMLANDELRVVLVTIHCSLKEAIERANFQAQVSAIRLAREGAMSFGIETPRVAVSGLNPHAGEGGLFGREEIEIIRPAVEACRSEGIDVSGPWPGDTVFMQARNGKFDVVVAQYHDQGLIPVKYLGLDKGVNITLGLPFIRTSPDHGTAFDIAGQGIADPASLKAAIVQAERLVEARRRRVL